MSSGSTRNPDDGTDMAQRVQLTMHHGWPHCAKNKKGGALRLPP